MDGYDQMIESESWKALKKASLALFDLQTALYNAGLDTQSSFEVRLRLGVVEGFLRAHFKRMAEAEIGK